MKERILKIALFIVVSSIYYATASGITSSNDGSHYALLRAMLDQHTFQIDSYLPFTEQVDYVERDGKLYSDRPPGTALAAIPFYALQDALPGPISQLPSLHDAGNPHLASLLMLPALAGAATAVLLYQLLRGYDLSIFAALTASLTLALGTTLWKYSSVLFSHSLSALLVLAAISVAIRVTRAKRLHWPDALLLGFVLGFSVVVEYSNALFAVIVGLYVALRLNRALFRGSHAWHSIVALGLGGALPLAFLMAYNTANFGGPFTPSYHFSVGFAWATSFATTFDVPLSQGLPGMLWYGRDAYDLINQGMFLLMPATLIGLAGLWPFVKKNWREAALILGTFAVFLLLFSKHHTFSTGTADGRYLVPFLALWLVPAGFALDGLHRLERPIMQSTLLFAAYGLIFVSIRNALWQIGLSFNYHFDPGQMVLLEKGQFMPLGASPQGWAHLFNSVFVNVPNLPLLWIVEAAGLLLASGAIRLLAISPRLRPPGAAEQAG